MECKKFIGSLFLPVTIDVPLFHFIHFANLLLNSFVIILIDYYKDTSKCPILWVLLDLE